MTRVLLTYFILAILTSCSRTNVLNYKHRRFYKEKSTITNDTPFKLYQRVCYNRPGVVDEEFCHCVTFIFLDTAAAKAKKTLNLDTDTLIVTANYGISSVWNWGEESNKLSGQIEVLKWDKDEITLMENMKTFDNQKKKTKRFKGTRTFIRQKEK